MSMNAIQCMANNSMCRYSRAIDQAYPRLCVYCKLPEEVKKESTKVYIDNVEYIKYKCPYCDTTGRVPETVMFEFKDCESCKKKCVVSIKKILKVSVSKIEYIED